MDVVKFQVLNLLLITLITIWSIKSFFIHKVQHNPCVNSQIEIDTILWLIAIVWSIHISLRPSTRSYFHNNWSENFIHIGNIHTCSPNVLHANNVTHFAFGYKITTMFESDMHIYHRCIVGLTSLYVIIIFSSKVILSNNFGAKLMTIWHVIRQCKFLRHQNLFVVQFTLAIIFLLNLLHTYSIHPTQCSIGKKREVGRKFSKCEIVKKN
jgi:hypothetical protein